MQIDIEGPAGFRRAVAFIQKRKLKVSFLPAAGETVVGALECRVAKESFHTETRSSGVGASIGAFGVRVGGGTGRSTGERVRDGLRTDDIGELIITTRRMVFIGSKNTVDMPYARIVELAPARSGLRVSVTGRNAPVMLACKKGDYALAAASIASALRDHVAG